MSLSHEQYQAELKESKSLTQSMMIATNYINSLEAQNLLAERRLALCVERYDSLNASTCNLVLEIQELNYKIAQLEAPKQSSCDSCKYKRILNTPTTTTIHCMKLDTYLKEDIYCSYCEPKDRNV